MRNVVVVFLSGSLRWHEKRFIIFFHPSFILHMLVAKRLALTTAAAAAVAVASSPLHRSHCRISRSRFEWITLSYSSRPHKRSSSVRSFFRSFSCWWIDDGFAAFAIKIIAMAAVENAIRNQSSRPQRKSCRERCNRAASADQLIDIFIPHFNPIIVMF